MKFENTKVFNFDGALRGMRNPKESWHLSDSYYDNKGNFIIGSNDLKLSQALIKAGSEHRKFMRQIFVCVDITAPLYWWKEADTYKIGTVANSTSTMHKITSTPITRECFEIDDLDEEYEGYNFDLIVNQCEYYRNQYLNAKACGQEDRAKRWWKALIRYLPESWLQTRTMTMNYENIYSMLRQREHHKLNEWSGKEDNSLTNFVDWVKGLPCAKELLLIGS